MKQLILSLFALSMVACSATKSTTAFLNKELTAVKINSTEIAPTESYPTIRFETETGKVFGNSGCNSYFGSYTIEGETITFSHMGMTRRMCDPVSNEIESTYMEALNSVDQFRMEDGKLVLTNGEVTITYTLPTEE